MQDVKRFFPVGACPFALIAALLGIAFAGCGKKTGGSAAGNQAGQRTLQGECDRLFEIPHENDPNLRPTVVSEPGTNRYDWALRVVERGYQESGHSNSRWDAAAHRALHAYVDYSRLGTTDARFSELTNAVVQATAAGCDDPLIAYMHYRYGLAQYPASKESIAIGYIDIFRRMYASRYHPMLKFFAGYRALDYANRTEPKGNRQAFLELVNGTLEDLVHDTNAPVGEVFDGVSMWVDYSQARGWIDYMMMHIEADLEKRWSQEEPYCRLFGRIEVDRAWASRGSGFANTVTDQGWEGFRKHLDKADHLLHEAWRMNPTNATTAYYMMQVELGQGQGRERMERWFNRAMALAPGYYDAVKLASFYLEPRWYGSEEDALQFARGCVKSTNWVGRVPLVLPNVHHSLAAFYKKADSPEYWHRTRVWEDVRAGYEKFFKLNPEESGWRHDYARDAYLCGHYDVFLAQTKLFDGWTNYPFFGGKEKFNQMLAKASAEEAGQNH